MRKECRNLANCMRTRSRCEVHKPVDPYFIAATVANIKYLALIFEYSNLFRERVKITTCQLLFFFAGSAELWPRYDCSRRNADRCAFPLAVRDLISHRFCTIYSERYPSKIIKIKLYKTFPARKSRASSRRTVSCKPILNPAQWQFLDARCAANRNNP